MNELASNTYGPQGNVLNHQRRLERALEHARRVVGAQAATRGVLDPDGAAIWLRCCEQAGIGGAGRPN